MAGRKFLIGLVLVFGFALAPLAAIAAQEQAAGAPGGASEAMALLKRTGEFLAQSPQFSVTIRAGYDVLQGSGQKIEFGENRQVVVRRPDRFRSDVERSDGEKATVLFDGKDVTVFSEKQKVFAKASMPGDIDGAVTYLLSDLNIRLPLAMMYLSRLPAEIDRRVRSVEMVERSVLMDVPCAHLAARADAVDFQIWIPTEGDPLPRRIVITYKYDKGQPQFWANLSGWNLAPNPADSLFAFSPAEGSREIPFLAKAEFKQPETAKVSPRKKGGKK